MDTFSLFAVSNELKDCIIGGRINKIFNNSDNFIFKLSNKNNIIFALATNLSFFFVTDKDIEHPLSPPAFCMLLRKYLLGSVITDVISEKFYRTVKISLIKKDSYINLYITFSGKKNNLILEINNEIIANFKGHAFEKFEKIPLLEKNEFLSAIQTEKLPGFPPFCIKDLKYLLNKFGEDKAYEQYLKLYNFNINFFPVLINNKPFPFLPVHLEDKENQPIKKFETFNEMFRTLFFTFQLKKLKEDITKYLKKEIKKTKNTLSKIEKELKEKSEFEKYFQFGELLKSNIFNIKKGDKSIILTNYYDENLSEITVPLKPDKTPVENVEIYFKKGKKFKRGFEKLIEREDYIKQHIKYLEETLFFVENSSSVEDLQEISYEINFRKEVKRKNKSVKETSRPYKLEIFNNVKIYIGKTSKSNDYLLKNIGKPEFLWFHVKDFPGSHVIIAENQDKISEDLIEFAAKLTFKNSKAKNNGKGEVIYTPVKYVKKPKGAPPGLVTVQKFKTIFVSL